MPDNVQTVLVRSLLQRFFRDPATGLMTVGAVSELEFEALRAIVDDLHGRAAPPPEPREPPDDDLSPGGEAAPGQVDAPDDISVAVLLDRSLESAPAPDRTHTLCLDFGTAASKACVTGPFDKLLPLPLGRMAGEPQAIHLVSSSIALDEDGLVWFGPEAVRRSADAAVQRLDSIKSALWEGDRGQGDRALCFGGLSLSTQECVRLYLGYLSHVVAAALGEAGLPRYLPRRYAMPFADDDRHQQIRAMMASWVGQGQILADTFGTQFEQGIPVAVLKGALAQLNSVRAPAWFLRDDPTCISEAVAASAYAIEAQGTSRQLFLVMDIGAGTTDLCLLAVKPKHNGDIETIRFGGGTASVPIAGDAVDLALRAFIQRTLEPVEDDLNAAHITRSLRRWKEALFTVGEIVDDLPDSTPVFVELHEFLAAHEWAYWVDTLKEAQARLLADADRSWLQYGQSGPIKVVLTGGGATLPIVADLADGRVGGGVARSYLPVEAHGLALKYPELVKELPRLAVCVGGSATETPTETVRTASNPEAAKPAKWTLKPFYKSGTED